MTEWNFFSHRVRTSWHRFVCVCTFFFSLSIVVAICNAPELSRCIGKIKTEPITPYSINIQEIICVCGDDFASFTQYFLPSYLRIIGGNASVGLQPLEVFNINIYKMSFDWRSRSHCVNCHCATVCCNNIPLSQTKSNCEFSCVCLLIMIFWFPMPYQIATEMG